MPLKAFTSVFRNRRFWVWELGGAVIYSIPATIRLVTGSVTLPIFSLVETPWISYFIPGNIVEKILVNAFFPGGAGGVAGEIYYSNVKGKPLSGKAKYRARLIGALAQTAVWSLIQFAGGILGLTGTWGGNLLEYPTVFPLNFLLASLSIFTPDIIGFLKNKAVGAYCRLKRNKQR